MQRVPPACRAGGGGGGGYATQQLHLLELQCRGGSLPLELIRLVLPTTRKQYSMQLSSLLASLRFGTNNPLST